MLAVVIAVGEEYTYSRNIKEVEATGSGDILYIEMRH